MLPAAMPIEVASVPAVVTFTVNAPRKIAGQARSPRIRKAARERPAAGHTAGRRLLLHFGAVDYRADVWIDGRHVAAHEGGHTPFTAEEDQGQEGKFLELA